MNNAARVGVVAIVAAALFLGGSAGGKARGLIGTEEFGLNPRELVQKIEQVEASIAKCMRAQGFEYVAVDAETVRRGMAADKTLPGLEEREFIARYGFGMSTLYTGKPPQLATAYSPGKMGLGRQNVRIFKNLSPADQVAYSRALFGENPGATFAVALDAENFSRCGGCTREAIERAFEPEHLKATYYNPTDALINKDPRMKAALREYGTEMRGRGFQYDHPDEVEADVQRRLDAITDAGSLRVEELTPARLAALKELQDYERKVAVVNFELEERLIEPVERKIQAEMFARRVE